MQVRLYEEKDKNNVRSICLNTAYALDESIEKQHFLLKLYCDYYIEKEPQNCFVLADNDDNAVGYILCCENYSRYKKAFRDFYLSDIRKIGVKEYITAIGDIASHGIFSRRFPSHMHIDILPEYQHKGFGTQLLDALTDNLKSKGINSVMLVVGSDNEKGVNFYKKSGFNMLFNFGFCYVMTLCFGGAK